MSLKYNEVFTPNEQPLHSYVDRQEHGLEQKLRDHLETPGLVINISGPSKSGKTVLVRKIVSDDEMITISGSSISSVDQFWRSLFSWLQAPSEISATRTDAAAARFGVGWLGATFSSSDSSSETEAIDPFRTVVNELSNSDFVIFIDDFHYISKDCQQEIAKIVKGLAENGVKICTASVPHRNDDVVRANPELRGRLAAIDIEPWSKNELMLIARKGFIALNYRIANSIEGILADEAFATPQLMQAICMNICRVCNLRESATEMTDVPVNQESLQLAFKDTSDLANFATLSRKLHSGPKIHGTERKTFHFSDSSTGDVYRACLLAIADIGPLRSINYDKMLTAIKERCVGDAPVGSSVKSTLEHMARICSDEMHESPVIEWDEDVLSIIDPYFLFYLRKSDQLQRLGVA